jgi:hypothetical protein
MNSEGYKRIIRSTGKEVYITTQMLSRFFKDPFYYGVLRQGNQDIDLFSVYDFQPVITEKEFYQVQALSDKRVQPYKQTRAVYYPLKMMVTCSFCGNHMYVGAVQGHLYKYLTYRCGNKYCTRTKKSIRGKVIFEFIYALLGDGLNFGEKEYQQYLASMKQHTGNKREEIEKEIHSKQGQLKVAERSQHDLALKIPDFEKGSPVYNINVERVNELQTQIDSLTT